ncbi:hypothetical protein EIP86_003504 [Pleurotus ostreatoroseus]|nr:hypothetical protein EIP86_003504 [Pleurotus ostreatoroseus]
MAETQHLVDYLVSAATGADKEGTLVLYTDSGNLISKHLVSGTWTDEETLAEEARKDSPACYLLGPTTTLILYISSTSELRGLQYNKEEEEWTEFESIPAEQLHSEGNLAACLYPDNDKEGLFAFFQVPSGELVCLDQTWSRFTLPAQPLIGTPLFADFINNAVHVFYVSKEDHCVHFLRKGNDGWVDAVATKCTINKTMKRIMIGLDEKEGLEVYALTPERELLRINSTEGGTVTIFGTVGAGGKYVASRATENAWVPYWPRPGGQQWPGQQYPGQQWPGQRWPGQQWPGQRWPGQQWPGQQW